MNANRTLRFKPSDRVQYLNYTWIVEWVKDDTVLITSGSNYKLMKLKELEEAILNKEFSDGYPEE